MLLGGSWFAVGNPDSPDMILGGSHQAKGIHVKGFTSVVLQGFFTSAWVCVWRGEQ